MMMSGGRKNINAKIDPSVFDELTVISWYLGVSRSDIVREMLSDFRGNGYIFTEDGAVEYQEVLVNAENLMHEMNQSIYDIAGERGKRPKRDDHNAGPQALKDAEKLIREFRKGLGEDE